MKKLIDRLHVTGSLDREQWIQLLSERSEETDQYARDLGNKVRQQIYGNDIYVRGLIEFTNYCKNDCYYCGIRRSNKNAQRYRLTEEDILLAVSRVMSWDSGLLFFREERTDIIQTKDFFPSYIRLKQNTRTVR